MQTFAERLSRLMDEKRVTQDELAEAAGVSQMTISKYKRGEIEEPGVSIVIKIAKALKVPVTYFYPDMEVEPQRDVSGGHRIIDHLITENENLWHEQKSSTEERLKAADERIQMLSMLQHFILKGPVSN